MVSWDKELEPITQTRNISRSDFAQLTKQAKILVVEDSGFIRRAMSQSLVKEGFAVVDAATGEEGIQRAKEELPDLILLDMMLPRLNGMMVLRILRGDPATHEIPVIVLSGTITERDVAEAEKLGISRFFQKDSSPIEQLVAAIRESLRARA